MGRGRGFYVDVGRRHSPIAASLRRMFGCLLRTRRPDKAQTSRNQGLREALVRMDERSDG